MRKLHLAVPWISPVTKALVALAVVCGFLVVASPHASAVEPTIRAYTHCYPPGEPRTYSYRGVMLDLRVGVKYTLRFDLELSYSDGTKKYLRNTKVVYFVADKDGSIRTPEYNGYGSVTRVEATVRVYRTSNGNHIGTDTGACNR
jgi:hypothetical protein